MKYLSITLLFVVALSSNLYSQETSTPVSKSQWSLSSFNVIPKIGAMRSVGLKQINDDFANSGNTQLPIISITSGIEFSASFGRLGVGVEYSSFSYSSLLSDFSPSALSSLEKTELRGYDLNAIIGFDLIKSERYRFEPALGIGAKTAHFTMQTGNSVSFSQVLSGTQNGYSERDKIGLVITPSLRFSEKTPKGMDYFVEAAYRFMPTQFGWAAANMPVKSLSGIGISLGISIDVMEIFRPKN